MSATVHLKDIVDALETSPTRSCMMGRATLTAELDKE
jgi:hypothetical protein